MTPFAQLAFVEKSAAASPPPGYQYAQGPTGLNNPYAAAVPTPGGAAAPTAPRHWGWDAGELAADIGLGWNPITGVPWFGGKAVHDFSNGRWGSGALNTGLAALSFVPGASSVLAGVKGGAGVAKAAPALMRMGGMIGKNAPKMQAMAGRMTPAMSRISGVAGHGAVRVGAPVAGGVGLGVAEGMSGGPPEGVAPQRYGNGLIDNMAQTIIANKPV